MAGKRPTNLSQEAVEQAVQELTFPHIDRASALAQTRWQEAHHAFATGITQELSKSFRAPAHLAVATQHAQPPATTTPLSSGNGCSISFRCAGFSDSMYLHFDPASLFVWIDCMLGGCGSGIPPQRQLTPVEQQLMRFAATEILRVWDTAYRGVHSLAPTIIDVSQHPRALPNRIQIIPFDLSVGATRGSLSLVISHDNYTQLLDQLSSSLDRPAAPPSPEAVSRLSTSTVELVVNLAELKVRTSELMGLQVGDIITTDTQGDDLVNVHVEGKPKFQATVGSLKGHKAIRFAG